MAERASRSTTATPTPTTTANGSANGSANGNANGNAIHLAAPANPRGPRRSPTTGHVRRRLQSASEQQQQQQHEDPHVDEEEERSRSKRTQQRGGKAAAAAEAARSQSTPAEERPAFQRISTSEDDDDYWHAYFAIQSKNIAAHNGNSLAAAAAGVLRPGPARERPAERSLERPARDRTVERPAEQPMTERQAERPAEESDSTDDHRAGERPAAERPASDRPRRNKTDSTINRKSTALKALTDRRPSAPNFSTAVDGEPLPPTPKPTLRRRTTRSKSTGPPELTGEQAAETASETSSTTSKADKSVIWKKWSQAPEPSKKEVLSIDPAEVLRGLVPQEAEPVEPAEPEESGWSRKSSERVRARRKSSLRRERPKETEPKQEPKHEAKKPSWLSRLFGRRAAEVKPEVKPVKPEVKKVRVNWLAVTRDLRAEWRAFRATHAGECRRLRLMAHRCAASLLLMLLYCGLGGLVFRFIEGTFESLYKCGVKRVKRDFIDTLWTTSHNLREDEWKSRARRRLWEFEEQLHAAHEAGVTSYSGIKAWTFLNAVVYCLTVVTTIGYGHISPSTNTGRAATIIYAIFGIPMFLILLADFGKLFTRGIKFVWSFVRRLYYTGSCRSVRRTQPVREIMKGAQIMYDLATFRRPSMFPQDETGEEGADEAGRDVEEAVAPLQQPAMRREPPTPDSSEPPATPAPSAFEVDDEFNLPISVAIVILLLYIFVGASIYYIWESWGFFESFYFVFISMSTIGFGDFVPQHPMYMMASIVYLIFGLALTSMCINVVQEKLSDSFRQASAKIGATIGLRMAEQEEAAAAANAETPAAEEHEHGQYLSPNDVREVS